MRWLVVAPLLASAVASAAPSEESTPVVVTQRVAATAVERAQSRTLYMNRDGVMLRPGTNDAHVGTSSLVAKPTTIAPWTTISDDSWDQLMDCMHEVWQHFDVEVVDVRPGLDTPYIETVFAADPSQVGFPANVAGVSPFASDCGIIENSIVFGFTNKLPTNPRKICEVVSQEIGHSYGLDHELVAADPMTYLGYTGDRSFQDVEASCGETTVRACACGGTQNSYRTLLARLGAPGGDDTAPGLTIVSPSADAVVTPGFDVHIAASDNVGLSSIALFVDGRRAMTSATMTTTLPTDGSIALGSHVLRVEVIDTNGNVTSRTLNVVVEDAPMFGCNAGGGSVPGSVLALGLIALRRRRRMSDARSTAPSPRRLRR